MEVVLESLEESWTDHVRDFRVSGVLDKCRKIAAALFRSLHLNLHLQFLFSYSVLLSLDSSSFPLGTHEPLAVHVIASASLRLGGAMIPLLMKSICKVFFAACLS